MYREPVGIELGRQLFINLNKHIVSCLNDTLLTFFFADTICEAQLVKGDLRH